MQPKDHYRVVIVGGGSAGITVAAHLRNAPNPPEIAIIEPSDKHYYQPMWTLVGGGVFPKELSQREESDYIPPGATWIRDRVTEFCPEENCVTTEQGMWGATARDGKKISYDFLVVAAGIQIDWEKVKGLKENLGKDGVCSNYSYDSVESTWQNIQNFKGGKAVFTQPKPPIKCAGAPQKIMYLADDYFRQSGVRGKSELTFVSGFGGIFGVPKYAAALNKVIERKGIATKYSHNLVEIRPAGREAVFENLGGGSELVLPYDMIHVSPPQSSPGFIKQSPLADSGGWVDVDKATLRHVRYPNVFSIGDCSSLPTSKTGAAVRKQAPVLVDNVLASIENRPPTSQYDGYTSCPLVTGYGSLILAEFIYDNIPQETFPFDQSQERYSMYLLKAYGLPKMYWHGMLRGRA